MRRLKTVRRPPIYPKSPGHLPCSSLTHPLPLPSRRPSVSFGGFGVRLKDPGPLVVIWDNGPAHRGEAIRSYLTTSDLQLRLVALPAYSPDFNADEAVWDWAREEVTANECLGTKAQVQEKMNAFFGGLAHRKDEVKHRCRTLLQARADALIFTPALSLPSLQNVVPTLALV